MSPLLLIVVGALTLVLTVVAAVRGRYRLGDPAAASR
jgi:hypothetical protein